MTKLINKALKKYRCIPVQVKASLWFVICSVIQKGISIVTVPLFTRLMTTEQYGYYTTYISWYNLLLVFTSLNLFYGVFNNAMLKYNSDRCGYISTMQGLVFTITACFFVLYLCVQERANAWLGMSTPLVLMLFLELLITPCLQFWMAAQRFEYKYKSIVIVTLIKAIANPVLGLIMVVLSSQKDVARIASIVIVETAFCSIIAFIQFARGKKFFSKEYWKYALLFNLPLLPHYLSGQILNQSDRIMISHMVGNSAVAIYGVAYNVGLLMNIFTNAINGSYTPWFYQTLEKKDYSQNQKVNRVILLLMNFLVIILMFFGPEIISVLGSSEYKEGMYCIPPVAASAFFLFVYVIFADVEFFYEKKFFVLISSLLAALLNLILNFIFIRRFGYIAAAYTTLASYLAFCVFHFIFARMICRKENIPEYIFDLPVVILSSVGVVVTAVLMNFLYKNTLLRFGILAVVLIVLAAKRKGVIHLLKSTLSIIKTK